MPPEVRKLLEEEAERNDRSLNSEIVHRLQMTIELTRALNVPADATPREAMTEAVRSGVFLVSGTLGSLQAELRDSDEG